VLFGAFGSIPQRRSISRLASRKRRNSSCCSSISRRCRSSAKYSLRASQAFCRLGQPLTSLTLALARPAFLQRIDLPAWESPFWRRSQSGGGCESFSSRLAILDDFPIWPFKQRFPASNCSRSLSSLCPLTRSAKTPEASGGVAQTAPWQLCSSSRSSYRLTSSSLRGCASRWRIELSSACEHSHHNASKVY